MKCPDCETENPDTRKFCRKCGGKLLIICSQCDSENLPGDIFCGECGQKLSIPPFQKDLSFDEKLDKIQRYLPKGLTEKILSQRDRIEGERKQVTVMFCDMEGFTSLSEKLGPEEAYTIMDQVYEILIHKVHDFEGTVNEMTGDGIVALFGAPIALEDAPQRAIRSALSIHRDMEKFNDRIRDEMQTPRIKMRIGIHTGPVVVGTLGNDLRVEFKAVGDTVNLASRMEVIAEPGTSYVTEDTFKLTAGLFRFEGLGDRLIKGKEKPIKVFRVLAPSTSRTRFDVSSELGLTPFVGRERELELLIDGFERVKEGRGQAFSIVAEAGLGKSRLLYEFRKAVANENVTFLEGKCLSYSRNIPYHPVIDILKSSFRIRERDDDIDIKDKIKKGLKIIGADEASTLPYFLELLSVKDSGIDEIPMSPEARKDRLIEALNRNVLKGSEIRPVVMAIEDLHWIDKSSEERFKSLLDNISGARLFLIFTYRPEFVHTWGGRSYHSQVNLNRLSNRESLMIVSHLLGAEQIDSNLENMILDKTEGVPFFIEEFIKSLKDLKDIEKKDNKLFLTEDLQDVTIPSRIQDVIMARVDSLGEGAKEILQLGSVIGREFGHDLLMKIIDFSEQELLSRLSILKDSELLYERGIYPQSTYIFKHALTQESVYQSLLKSARQKYHRIIGETLEKGFPEIAETEPAIMAHHLTEAAQAGHAIEYWQKAVEIAVQRSANIEALSHFSKGKELLRTLPETQERMKRELDLLLNMRVPLVAVKGQSSPEIERNYSRARELCEKTGETQYLFIILFGLFSYYGPTADYQTYHKIAEELMLLAKEKQDQFHLVAAHRAMGTSLFYAGEFSNAKSHLSQAIDLYDTEYDKSKIFIQYGPVRTSSFGYTIMIMWLMGFPEQALKMSHDAIAYEHELSNFFSLALTTFMCTMFHYFCRDIDRIKELSEESIEISTNQRFPLFLELGTYFNTWALGKQKKDDKVISKMYHTLDNFRSTGYEQFRPFFLCLLSEAYMNLGNIEGGLNALEESIILVDQNDERFWEAEIYRLKGELLLAQSTENTSVAESCYHQAIDVSHQQQARSLELRAAMSMSRLWQSQGKKEEAKDLLSEIYGWFTEGFDTADLKEAKALLEELS